MLLEPRSEELEELLHDTIALFNADRRAHLQEGTTLESFVRTALIDAGVMAQGPGFDSSFPQWAQNILDEEV